MKLAFVVSSLPPNLPDLTFTDFGLMVDRLHHAGAHSQAAMKNLISSHSAIFSLIALSPLAARAATVSNDFSTDALYTGNFVEALNAGSIGYNAAGQNVLYNPLGDNSTSVIRYDTIPGNSLLDNANFLTETVSADFTFPSLTSVQSVGVITRIQSTNLGVMGLLNKVSATTVQLRLFYGASTLNVGAGTAFFDASFNLSTGGITSTTGTGGIGSTNLFAINSPLTISLAQAAGSDPVFSFSISDAEGLIASTGPQTLTATDDYNGAGAVGFRLNSTSTGVNNTITMDNFLVIPEPSTALLSALGALALLRRRR